MHKRRAFLFPALGALLRAAVLGAMFGVVAVGALPAAAEATKGGGMPLDRWGGPMREEADKFFRADPDGGPLGIPHFWNGDVDGDAIPETVIFYMTAIEGSASGRRNNILVLKSIDGFHYKVYAVRKGILGEQPYDVQTDTGKVLYSALIAGPHDPHCCPRTPKRFQVAIKPGVTDDGHESTGLTAGEYMNRFDKAVKDEWKANPPPPMDEEYRPYTYMTPEPTSKKGTGTSSTPAPTPAPIPAPRTSLPPQPNAVDVTAFRDFLTRNGTPAMQQKTPQDALVVAQFAIVGRPVPDTVSLNHGGVAASVATLKEGRSNGGAQCFQYRGTTAGESLTYIGCQDPKSSRWSYMMER